ncbi:MAG: Trp biosynthesis-associated membrane protein [Actinomycetales bacterium]|nr:Trp biosynthesis-associated membrane protein [Leifsonia sp.]
MSGATEQAPEVFARRVSRRAKYLSILLFLIGSGLVLLASTQTWFTVLLTPAAGHAGALTVQGTAAAPALTALSLAGLALAAALAIAGPVFRIVLTLLGLLLGASVLISAFTAMGSPIQSASSAITAATGVSGEASVARLVARVDVALWPAVAIAGGIFLLLGSIAVLVTGRVWPGPSRRYETRFEDQNGVSAADLFSEPEAQPAGEPEPRTESEAPGESETPATPLERDQAIDSWDELSRGEDPTR